MSAATRLTGRAAELRSAFDGGFAEPIVLDATVKADLLAIRVGAEACALRLNEISGLLVDKKITRVPGGAPALLGIAGFRGAIMPVFNLQSLLGRSTAATPRWLVIAPAHSRPPADLVSRTRCPAPTRSAGPGRSPEPIARSSPRIRAGRRATRSGTPR